MFNQYISKDIGDSDTTTTRVVLANDTPVPRVYREIVFQNFRDFDGHFAKRTAPALQLFDTFVRAVSNNPTSKIFASENFVVPKTAKIRFTITGQYTVDTAGGIQQVGVMNEPQTAPVAGFFVRASGSAATEWRIISRQPSGVETDLGALTTGVNDYLQLRITIDSETTEFGSVLFEEKINNDWISAATQTFTAQQAFTSLYVTNTINNSTSDLYWYSVETTSLESKQRIAQNKYPLHRYLVLQSNTTLNDFSINLTNDFGQFIPERDGAILEQLTIKASADSVTNWDLYAGISLTNGLEISIKRLSTNPASDFFLLPDFRALRTQFDLTAIGELSTYQQELKGFIVVKIPLYGLRLCKTDCFSVLLNDDFSGLSEHKMTVQGYWT